MLSDASMRHEILLQASIDAPNAIDEKQFRDLNIAVIKVFTEFSDVQLKSIMHFDYYHLHPRPDQECYFVYFSRKEYPETRALTKEALKMFCNSKVYKYYVNLNRLEMFLET